MPTRISDAVRRALSDAKITPAEINALRGAVSRGEVKPEELKLLSERYGDLFQAGAGKALTAISPPQAHTVMLPPLRSIGDTRAAAEVLSGARTLGQGRGSPKEAVRTFQRALNALAARMNQPEWALLGAGADGDYGPETARAVTAFQNANGLPATGQIDQMTALKMEELMMDHPAPGVGGVIGATLPVPDGNRIAQAARDLIATRAADYGVSGTWRSPNPNVPHNAVPNQTPLGAENRWKCNLFGMDALYAGGAQPPHYPGGNYPIAIEIPNYSRGENAPLIKLGEVWPGKTTPEEARAKIDALLKIARPGDVIIVNHPGSDTSDGGHTRIVVANNYKTDGTVDCAQASSDAARIRGETLGSFTGEEAFYLLRPAIAR
ncbi:MAG: peptidoglycan-binding protein [Myxococcaceae bacterium]|nr:peptidoglycan-binding protein [Myxococcaceae bacterium]